MSSFKLRLILREFTATRLWNACFRTQLTSTAKRCRRDRVREVWVCFRQTLLRPSRTLLMSAAACPIGDDDDEDESESDGIAPCSQDISDEDLQALVHDFEGVDELSRNTLFCEGCSRRLIIDKKHPGVLYCACPGTKPPEFSADGWIPYMEADDVIIWRKEYKPGGLYAYKVYGRYKDLSASDFAMIQVDGAYRRSWDDAVAALSIVENGANGVQSQTVLHWEVLWPRLFANRDYVYLRRHKMYVAKSKCLPHKEAIFNNKELQPCDEVAPVREARPSVHSRAKLKALEMDRKEMMQAKGGMEVKDNKVYVIVSRSCTHPSVPETRNAIRVQEYWSHMVVRTINGADDMGMEFVLTYYDEPSVGGLPTGVSAWATGRAAPSYLARMHRAALHYAAWRRAHHAKPDFVPFDFESTAPRLVDHKSPRKPPHPHVPVNEQDMESSKSGPELDSCYKPMDKGTQTDPKVKLGQSRDVGVDPIVDNNQGKGDIEQSKVADKVKPSDEAKHVEVAEEHVKVVSDDKVTDNIKANDEVIVIEKPKVDKVEAGEVKVTVDVKETDDAKVTESVKPSVPKSMKDTALTKNTESKEADSVTKEEQTEESEGDETRKSSWWRYLYPFYYFV